MHTDFNEYMEFARVIACTRCTCSTDRNLLRDESENVPQPGYIGENYKNTRVLLVGQNPGTPKSLAAKDLSYTAALRSLRDAPTSESYEHLEAVLASFIPQWPVHGNYFPLRECGLTLNDIAYCNAVRCRTRDDRAPNKLLTSTCISHHFIRWLELLQPRVVVFIGKWAAQQGGAYVAAAGIPYAYMNRQRSLSSNERTENRESVVQLVRGAVANNSFKPTPLRGAA
jgi:uracil-DNA glycosylase